MIPSTRKKYNSRSTVLQPGIFSISPFMMVLIMLTLSLTFIGQTSEASAITKELDDSIDARMEINFPLGHTTVDPPIRKTVPEETQSESWNMSNRNGKTMSTPSESNHRTGLLYSRMSNYDNKSNKIYNEEALATNKNKILKKNYHNSRYSYDTSAGPLITISIMMFVIACLYCVFLCGEHSNELRRQQIREAAASQSERPTGPRRLTYDEVQTNIPVYCFDGSSSLYVAPFSLSKLLSSTSSLVSSSPHQQELSELLLSESESEDKLSSATNLHRYELPASNSTLLGSECSICLDEFEIGDKVRVLKPWCNNHVFHSACIERWLIERSATCPLCKREIALQIPGETSDLNVDSTASTTTAEARSSVPDAVSWSDIFSSFFQNTVSGLRDSRADTSDAETTFGLETTDLVPLNDTRNEDNNNIVNSDGDDMETHLPRNVNGNHDEGASSQHNSIFTTSNFFMIPFWRNSTTPSPAATTTIPAVLHPLEDDESSSPANTSSWLSWVMPWGQNNSGDRHNSSSMTIMQRRERRRQQRQLRRNQRQLGDTDETNAGGTIEATSVSMLMEPLIRVE